MHATTFRRWFFVGLLLLGVYLIAFTWRLSDCPFPNLSLSAPNVAVGSKGDKPAWG
jgi:hypothetical protein